MVDVLHTGGVQTANDADKTNSFLCIVSATHGAPSPNGPIGVRIGLRFEVRGRRRAAAGTVFLKSEYREFRHAEKG